MKRQSGRVAISIYAVTFTEGFSFDVNKLNINESRITPIAPIGINHKNPIFENEDIKFSMPEGMTFITSGNCLCIHGQIADRSM